MSSSDSESSEASCECSEPKCVQFFYEEFDRPPLVIEIIHKTQLQTSFYKILGHTGRISRCRYSEQGRCGQGIT